MVNQIFFHLFQNQIIKKQNFQKQEKDNKENEQNENIININENRINDNENKININANKNSIMKKEEQLDNIGKEIDLLVNTFYGKEFQNSKELQLQIIIKIFLIITIIIIKKKFLKLKQNICQIMTTNYQIY